MDQNPKNPLNYNNERYILDLYEEFKVDPEAVGEEWKKFFLGVEFGAERGDTGVLPEVSEIKGDLRIRLLIDAYKKYGHIVATTSILEKEKENPEELSLNYLGFSKEELTQNFPTNGLLPESQAPLSKIIERLKTLYSSSIGFEYAHVDREIDTWITDKIVNEYPLVLSHEDHKNALKLLCHSEHFEDFLQKKHTGAKRFSLEGAESAALFIKELIDHGSTLGASRAVICMAHRGRLNVMSNIMGKPYSKTLSEFQTGYLPRAYEGSGDVKYHRGYAAEIRTPNNKTIQTILASNPSHLESVDPVMQGMVRAYMEQKGEQIVPLQVHGDSALSGQGINYETMQLKNLEGYKIDGTVHLVINNQIGFTTPPSQYKSTRYCSDLAKAFATPILHVNSDDIEACIFAARLAIELKNTFKTDVMIDLICHRKYGHNEQDEPRFTQPKMYELLKKKKSIYTGYKEKLLEKGIVDQAFVDNLESSFRKELDQALLDAKRFAEEESSKLIEMSHQSLERSDQELFAQTETGVDLAKLRSLGEKITTIPESFNLHPTLRKYFNDRKDSINAEPDTNIIDWATAETLSYASLLDKGIYIRISGQDAIRGTFSHRHAYVYDQKEEHVYSPLDTVAKDKKLFHIFNSLLSEYAVMGFEYGFSIAHSKALVIWEAQFGDFANGAQIICDQYISSAEQKWGRTCSLVLLLPHGLEGMGPEHSSCRIERYLQLAGNENMYVCNPSTPAQFFHLFRRQILRQHKRPLIIASHKSLLRYKPSYSTLSDLSSKCFEEIIDDPFPPKKAHRVLLCSGKVYYDLVKARHDKKIEDVAIVRVEQLYPLHIELLKEVLSHYRWCKEVVWVQEESSNNGAWDFIRPYLREVLQEKVELKYVGRPRSASPATGYATVHKNEQQELVDKAFNLEI